MKVLDSLSPIEQPFQLSLVLVLLQLAFFPIQCLGQDSPNGEDPPSLQIAANFLCYLVEFVLDDFEALQVFVNPFRPS